MGDKTINERVLKEILNALNPEEVRGMVIVKKDESPYLDQKILNDGINNNLIDDSYKISSRDNNEYHISIILK